MMTPTFLQKKVSNFFLKMARIWDLDFSCTGGRIPLAYSHLARIGGGWRVSLYSPPIYWKWFWIRNWIPLASSACFFPIPQLVQSGSGSIWEQMYLPNYCIIISNMLMYQINGKVMFQSSLVWTTDIWSGLHLGSNEVVEWTASLQIADGSWIMKKKYFGILSYD